MKILVCTDGSVQSQESLEEAAEIVEGYKPDDVAIIHVYQAKDIPYLGEYISKDRIENLKKTQDQQKEEANKILAQALETFEKKNIKARTFLGQGTPSEAIARVALEEEFDMVVVCSRGRGGLRKIQRKIKDVGSRPGKAKFTLVPALFMRHHKE